MKGKMKGFTGVRTWVIKIFVLVLLCGSLLFVGLIIKQKTTRHRKKVAYLKRIAPLETISLALQNYHDQYSSFPPAYVFGEEDRRWHSWRVLLLPFLGEEAEKIHQQYRFDEPWDSPHNKLLSKKMPDAYRGISKNRPAETTPYVAIVSNRSVWPGPASFSEKVFRKNGYWYEYDARPIQLIEYRDSGINWMEPRDITLPGFRQYIQKIKSSDGVNDKEVFVFLLGDGVGRYRIPFLCDSEREDYLLALLTPTYGWSHFTDLEKIAKYFPEETTGSQHHINHQFKPRQNAENLSATVITPHLSQELKSGKNVVYCATFQIVWDECRNIKCVGKPILLESHSLLAQQLNKHPFPQKSLSPESYYVAGGSIEKLTEQLKTRFPNTEPNLTPPTGKPSVTFYCSLEKNMPFQDDFEVLESSIVFEAGNEKKKVPVKAFGVKQTFGGNIGDPVYKKQVLLLHYASENDFIIQLLTDSKQKDLITLAKIPPGKTLLKTYENAMKRIEKKSVSFDRFQLETVDNLSIPIMEFHIEKIYDELINQSFLNEELAGYRVGAARQLIKFRLDEKGGILESKAEYSGIGSFGDGGPPKEPQPRTLIFNKPFLLILKELGAEKPYFVSWMSNTELMEPLPELQK